MNLSEPTRAYIYRVAVAVLPLLVALGYLTESLVPLIVTLLAAVFVPALAAVNTPTGRHATTVGLDGLTDLERLADADAAELDPTPSEYDGA